MMDKYGSGQHLTGQITDGHGIRQSFCSESDYLEHVSIHFATYKRRNTGCIIVSIYDKLADKILADREINTADLEDNSFKDISFNIDLSRGAMYELRVRSRGSCAGRAVTAKWGPKRHHKSYFYNGPAYLQGELYCHIEYGQTDPNYTTPTDTKTVEEPNQVSGMVSIIIPNYNCFEYLPRCLQHVLKQSYDNIEIIIVDDGSKDAKEVKSFIKGIAEHSPIKIELICHDKNKGASAARNTGYKYCSGEYVFFLDSDTFLREDCLDIFTKVLSRHPGQSYTYCGFKWGKKTIKGKPYSYAALKKENYISTMSLIRRDHFTGFDETLPRLQDWDLWLSMAKIGKHGVWAGKDNLFESIEREGSISHKHDNKYLQAKMTLTRKHGIR